MIRKRLRQFRLARGLSLEGLAAQLDHLVTRQTLSKYERGLCRPSARVAARIARVLGVKNFALLEIPRLSFHSVAYRSEPGLRKKEKARVENLTRLQMEERVRIQNALRPVLGIDFNLPQFRVGSLEEVEKASLQLRRDWQLGLGPIPCVTDLLEDRLIHVVEMEVDDTRFDGISAIAQNEAREAVAAIVVSRRGVCGERQRLSLLHELGHLVLEMKPGLDPERAAFYFGAALLAPKPTLHQTVGTRRKRIEAEELLLHKRYFGISLQALLHRLFDLEIINQSYFKRWSREINRRGWKACEPNESPSETPTWLRRNLLRARAEGVITRSSDI